MSRWCSLFSRHFLIALFSGILLTDARGDSGWIVRTWQLQDGLPNNTVTGFAQTPDGYLWIATRAALVRFDGVGFESFFATNFMSPPAVLESLAVDRQGALWAATSSRQLVRHDARGTKVLGEMKPEASRLSPVLIEDGEGHLWVHYKNGELWQVTNERFVAARTPEGKLVAGVDWVTRDRAGRVWCKQGARLQPGLGVGPAITLPRPGGKTRGSGASDGGLWICSGSMLLKWDGGRWTNRGTLAMRAGGIVNVMLEDRGGALWLGTSRNGVFRFDGSQFESIPLSDQNVLALFEDREGNVWAGTSAGLNQIRPRALELESGDSGLPYDVIQSVCEDAGGTLWAATRNNRLLCRVNSRWTTNLPGLPWRGRASRVAADPAGGLWIGTIDRALHRWQEGRLATWGPAEGLIGHSVRALLVDSRGDVWIASTAPAVVQRWRNGQFTLPLPPTTPEIFALTEDAAGNVWLGGEHGGLLCVAPDGTVRDETSKTLPGSKTIRSLHGTREGSLWIGYAGGGIGRFKADRFARILPEHGLPDDSVSQIVADQQGWLWFGATRGIFRIRQSELDAFAEGLQPRVRAVWTREGEGLRHAGSVANYSSGAVRDRAGTLWIPTHAGLVSVHPDRLRESPDPPPVLIRRVMVDERTLLADAGPRFASSAIGQNRFAALPARHQRVQFDFTAPTFTAPENLQFRYRLIGWDSGWVSAGAQRTVAYARLPAGEYRFVVQACNGEGQWSQPEAAVAFAVTPFFWQTGWFQLSALVGFTALIVLLVRYTSFRRLQARLRTIERQAALDKERARIARDIHDDVGGNLTKILLLTELALRHRARPAGAEEAAERIQEIAGATRQVLKSLDETVWAINPRHDTLAGLSAYLSQFAADFLRHAQVRCRIDVPDQLPAQTIAAEARHHLFLATKEALHNAVKHAKPTEVTLRIAGAAAAIVIEIADNGRGFAPADDCADGDGLRNLRQRMEEIAGSVRIESRPATGTRVTLTVPCANPRGAALFNCEARP